MRLPVGLCLAVLALPASAGAATAGLEGSRLVFRADPGEAVSLFAAQVDGGRLGDLRDGPFALDGGAGNDVLEVRSSRPGGGRFAAAPAAIVCGPGADRWSAGPRDRPGAGCAPHLTGVTPARVSRAFREGVLSAAASGSVSLRRVSGDPGRAREVLARGTFTARPGPLRVSLRPTAAGRRHDAARVRVQVRTSDTHGDRGTITFESRLAR